MLQRYQKFNPIADDLQNKQLTIWGNRFPHACLLACLFNIRELFTYF